MRGRTIAKTHHVGPLHAAIRDELRTAIAHAEGLPVDSGHVEGVSELHNTIAR